MARVHDRSMNQQQSPIELSIIDKPVRSLCITICDLSNKRFSLQKKQKNSPVDSYDNSNCRGQQQVFSYVSWLGVTVVRTSSVRYLFSTIAKFVVVLFLFFNFIFSFSFSCLLLFTLHSSHNLFRFISFDVRFVVRICTIHLSRVCLQCECFGFWVKMWIKRLRTTQSFLSSRREIV